MNRLVLPVSLLLAACQADAPPSQPFAAAMAEHPVGRLLTYERSNQDGTRPERIDVYRASDTRLEVMKYTARCTQAALVSAELDFDTWSADSVTGGALLPGAQVMEFAFLTHDRDTGQLNTEVRLPDQTLTFETAIPGVGTLHLYDFDLASLTALTPYLADPEAGFSTRFVLMWADPANPSVTFLGEQAFAFEGRHEAGGRDVNMYAASGPALGEGFLLLDANEGYIVEASFAEPNHPGYDDFLLRLTGVEDIGAEGWHQHLAAQYAGCEE